MALPQTTVSETTVPQTTLAQAHDCVLLDLDGTLFRGARPTEGAVDALADVEARRLFITNNASRSPDEVAQHLRALGFDAAPDDVVTSAQSAARLLAAELPGNSAVLVVGTDSLSAEVAAVGLRPVRGFADDPVAVVQGYSSATGWSDLAEAALAIRAGALWVATNVDKTFPTERGLVPGNGSMVAALRTATGTEPRVAGKPAPAVMSDALTRGVFHAPLVVGDRLDTDIAGASAATLPSLMVLSGVGTAHDAVTARADSRPTYLGHDLRSLHRSRESLRVGPQRAWDVRVRATSITVFHTGHDDEYDDEYDDGLSIVRACASAVWSDNPSPEANIIAGDEKSHVALQACALLT